MAHESGGNGADQSRSISSRDVGAPRRRGPLRWVLDLFSNVWLGVSLMVLLFFYCSIGSAFPPLRELPSLEMTEFEWFHWWPFNTLIVLTGLNLAVVTIRRIPLRMVNAGVWMIHTGIITLLIGSFLYFQFKIEGDTPVFRRQVRIELPGLKEARSIPALPGNEIKVTAGPDVWTFAVESTNSEWPILSGDDKGKKAYTVNVQVTPPKGQPFVRQLLAGFPQYTEDVIPGKGRAVKVTGKKLLDEALQLWLDLEPQEYFHVMKSWALFIRKAGEREWTERPLSGMPRYHDRLGSREQVFFDPRYPVELRPLDLAVPPAANGDALRDASVRVTGYLKHAQMQRHWRDGGEAFNPVLRITAGSAEARRTYDLVALSAAQSKAESGAEFRWLSDASEIQNLPTDLTALLTVAVPAANVSFNVPLSGEVVVGRDGPFTPIENTDFSYRILNVVDDLAMPDGRKAVSIVMVEVKTPESQFTRMVADQPDTTRDIHGDSDPHATSGRRAQPVDSRIQMTYRPRAAPVLLAGHPGGLYLAVNGAQGRVLGRNIQIGEEVEIVPGLSVRAEALWLRAVLEEKPFVVPPPARDRGMEENMAMIRLEVATGGGVHSEWLPFNQYAMPSEQYAYFGRLAYSPKKFRMADGSVVEVLFSRRRMKLPNPVALEDFALDTHVGGFTGSLLTIRNYISQLRFRDGASWTAPTPTAVNQPATFGELSFFQASWDKPPSESPTGGMNYTGLGVGNRRGVVVQLAGCCLSVAGMCFAFYVKPVLKRRRKAAAMARISRDELSVLDAELDDPTIVPHSGTEIRTSDYHE